MLKSVRMLHNKQNRRCSTNQCAIRVMPQSITLRGRWLGALNTTLQLNKCYRMVWCSQLVDPNYCLRGMMKTGNFWHIKQGI